MYIVMTKFQVKNFPFKSLNSKNNKKKHSSKASFDLYTPPPA